MIAAHSIEEALVRLESPDAVEGAMLAFATAQPALVQWFQTDTFELLTPEERDYLQYLALVIYGALTAEVGRVAALDGGAIETWEERSWTWLEGSVGRPMSERLDVFFASIDQEELLAFAEDSLVDPDEDTDGRDLAEAPLFVSGPSRELGFVGLAALIGALDEAMRRR